MVNMEFAASLRRHVQCGPQSVAPGSLRTVLDTALASAPPELRHYHLVYRHGMELAPDLQTLAMSSTTGGLWISADSGERWHCVSRDLPPVAALGWVAA